MAKRNRDYKAEYARRVAKAKAQGLSAAQGYGKPSKAKGEKGINQLRAQGILPGKARKVKRKSPQHVNTAAGRITTTASENVLTRAIRSARHLGRTVAFKITACDNRQRWATRTVDAGTPHTRALIEAAKAGSTVAAGSRDGGVALPTQMVASDSEVVMGGAGFDAADLVAYFNSYEDWLDALWFLWAVEY